METNEKVIDNPYGFIYITTNMVNGMRYLGQKKFDEFNDWKHYLGSGTIIQHAIKKYGRENFSRNIVCLCSSLEELNKSEYDLSVFLNVVEDKNWYNIVYGGGATKGLRHTEETREQMSEQRKGKYDGEKNPMYGKPRPEGGGKPSRKVINLNTLKVYEDSHSAERDSNLSRGCLSTVCLGKRYTAGGCFWMYYDDYMFLLNQMSHEEILSNKQKELYDSKHKSVTEEVKQKISNNSRNKHKVVQYSLSGEKIKEYDSIQMAAKNTNTHPTSLKDCCTHKYKTANGFMWRYKEEVEGQTNIEPYVDIKCVQVVQLSKNGDFVSQYDSLSEASRATGVLPGVISDCCNGKIHRGGDYVWMHLDDYNQHGAIITKNPNFKPVVQLTLDGKFMAEYVSLRDAEKQTLTDHTSISNCCRKKGYTANGFKWIYADEYYNNVQQNN